MSNYEIQEMEKDADFAWSSVCLAVARHLRLERKSQHLALS